MSGTVSKSDISNALDSDRQPYKNGFPPFINFNCYFTGTNPWQIFFGSMSQIKDYIFHNPRKIAIRHLNIFVYRQIGPNMGNT